MKKILFQSILFITIHLSGQFSLATSECYGLTKEGKEITVKIETSGPKGLVQGGEIIFGDQGNHYGYQISKNDISQYFEFDDSTNGTAVVGLIAYTEVGGPVVIKYVGTNFVDLDLKTIYAKGAALELKGNSLRVWKGPGYETTNQYNLSQLVCSTWPEI